MLANRSLFSSTGAKLTIEGGMTGAVYSAFLKPVDSKQNSFALAKLKNMADDFATFSTLSAASVSLTPRLRALALPAVQRAPSDSGLIERATAAAAAAGLGGVPAAVVDSGTRYLTADQEHKPDMKDLAKSIYSFSIIGAGMRAAMPVQRKIDTPEPPKLTPEPPKLFNIVVNDSVGFETSSPNISMLNPRQDLTTTKAATHELEPGNELAQGKRPATEDSHIIQLSELARKFTELPDANFFKRVLEKRAVGTIPAPFLEGGLELAQIITKLDSLALALRSLDAVLPPQKKQDWALKTLTFIHFRFSWATK
jgi:hypothetical protein